MLCSKAGIKTTFIINKPISRYLSIQNLNTLQHNCKLLVIGGGTGGCTMASKFSNKLKKNEIIIVEPSNKHYYQPMFTMIGGGIKTLQESFKPMKNVLPSTAKWIRDHAAEFDPENNIVITANNHVIHYDYMIVAMGLQLNFDAIPGLEDALKMPGGVCSNYSPKYVQRTYEALQKFKEGNIIFTFPNTPVKCPGAPQKIMYITEHYLRKTNKRKGAKIYYNSSLPVIFGVKKYADALWKIIKNRDLHINLLTNLVEIKPEKNVAYFENILDPSQKNSMEYSMLHVTPPMGAPDALKNNKSLTNQAGFLEVNKDTLQHVKFNNIFGIGDCTNSPNSKTAASVAAQSRIVYHNLKAVMSGKTPTEVYDGYASCPLVTGYNSCILAEFDYNLKPMETFPISQDREMYLMYLMKKDIMPTLYWQLMLKGYWNGPAAVRKIMHTFSKH